MGEWIELVAADGHALTAYRTPANGGRRGGIVVIQEVFGVNGHIRNVCDGFAAHGYDAVAPSLFDRVEAGVALAYDDDGIAKGRELVGRLGWERPLIDVWAAALSMHPQGRVGVVGYCWGGTVAWLAACRLDGGLRRRLLRPADRRFSGRPSSLPDHCPLWRRGSADPARCG